VAYRYQEGDILRSITWENCLLINNRIGTVRLFPRDTTPPLFFVWMGDIEPLLELDFIPPDWTPQNIQEKLSNLIAFI
jgi:hypothetical protein